MCADLKCEIVANLILLCTKLIACLLWLSLRRGGFTVRVVADGNWEGHTRMHGCCDGDDVAECF